jgi:two-component system, chemotaxis family, protein-glutamate methylesterase/glutaminase
MIPIRVFIVDDSSRSYAFLADVLERDGDIRVTGHMPAHSANMAGQIEVSQPDLVIVDVHEPSRAELDLLKQIRSLRSEPILLVVGGASDDESRFAFQAMSHGAVDLAVKPKPDHSQGAALLRMQVRLLAGLSAAIPVGTEQHVSLPEGHCRSPAAETDPGNAVLVAGVAGGAGGPSALLALLSGLSARFSGCLAVVQRLPAGFTASFAKFLQARTDLRVRIAESAVPISAGSLLLPPEDRHLIAYDRDSLGPSDVPAASGLRPSADVLFRSLAETFGRNTVGVILSGTGDDGSAGLLALRMRGALTIAESRDTAAAYGMPRAALERGAALRALRANDISHVLQGAAAEHRAVREALRS